MSISSARRTDRPHRHRLCAIRMTATPPRGRSAAVSPQRCDLLALRANGRHDLAAAVLRAARSAGLVLLASIIAHPRDAPSRLPESVVVPGGWRAPRRGRPRVEVRRCRSWPAISAPSALAVILVEGGLTTRFADVRTMLAPAGVLATLGVGDQHGRSPQQARTCCSASTGSCPTARGDRVLDRCRCGVLRRARAAPAPPGRRVAGGRVGLQRRASGDPRPDLQRDASGLSAGDRGNRVDLRTRRRRGRSAWCVAYSGR